MKSKRIKHNDLLPWFLQDHGTLPAAYLASCEKFFKSIKPQASSCKQQAASNKRLTDAGPHGMYGIRKDK
tara:strand:- start:145 stop:354 length:210 start_codon:yes stop_codon:yes gene_type:complete